MLWIRRYVGVIPVLRIFLSKQLRSNLYLSPIGELENFEMFVRAVFLG